MSAGVFYYSDCAIHDCFLQVPAIFISCQHTRGDAMCRGVGLCASQHCWGWLRWLPCQTRYTYWAYYVSAHYWHAQLTPSTSPSGMWH